MRRIRNAHRASVAESTQMKMIQVSSKPIVVQQRLRSDKKMSRKSSKMNPQKSGLINQVFHRKLGYLPEKRQNIVSSKNLGLVKKSEKTSECLSKESEMIIKNSLIYRKLQLEYQNMRKQFNKEKAVLNRAIREIQLQTSSQQNNINKLKEKKNKLIQQIEGYTNELVELQTRNYELYWQFCAQFEEMNEEYEDFLEMEEEVGSVSKGFNQNQISALIQQHRIGNINCFDEKCCICCSQLSNQKGIVKLNCCHKYHAQCLEEWLKISKQCPLCRKQLP